MRYAPELTVWNLKYDENIWVECWDKRGKLKGSLESRILRRGLYIELDTKVIDKVGTICLANRRSLFPR